MLSPKKHIETCYQAITQLEKSKDLPDDIKNMAIMLLSDQTNDNSSRQNTNSKKKKSFKK